MNQVGRSYPSDLTNQQWELIRELIPSARRGGRKRTTDVRKVLDAIFYLSRSGCAWRYLPSEFPPWTTVYDYFRRWQSNGILEKIRTLLAEQVRLSVGKKAIPSVAIIDSQSTKCQYGEARGYDGFKKVRGRKRHIIVDTMGIIHAIKITSANVGDARDGAELFKSKKDFFDQRGLDAVYADAGYRNTFAEEIHRLFKTKPKILRSKKELRRSTRPQDKGAKKWVVVENNLAPVRWIVERTFAWFNNFRRLARDYEKKMTHSEAMINVAMIQILLQKLQPQILQ